mgnify:CR=1 FL=1
MEKFFAQAFHIPIQSLDHDGWNECHTFLIQQTVYWVIYKPILSHKSVKHDSIFQATVSCHYYILATVALPIHCFYYFEFGAFLEISKWPQISEQSLVNRLVKQYQTLSQYFGVLLLVPVLTHSQDFPTWQKYLKNKTGRQ